MINKAAQDQEQEYIEKYKAVPETVHKEVESEKAANSVSGSSASKILDYEASIRDSLSIKKRRSCLS